jgi:MFS family permease
MTPWFSASAVVPQLRALWALNDDGAAWLTIAVQLGFMTGAVLSSFFNLADIVAPRHLIFAGALGATVANSLLLLADGVVSALPLRFATGFFLAGVYPTSLKLMATWFVRGRGVALGTLVAALTLGTAGPHLVNGLGGLDWRVVIVVTSVSTLLGAVIVELLVREGPFPFPAAVFDPRQVGAVLRNRAVRLASLGYFGHMWELFAAWAWFLPFYAASLRAAGRPSGTLAAFATFAFIAAGAPGSWLAGLLGDRWGRTATTALMLGVSATCSLTIGLLYGRSPWLLLALGLVWGFTVVADSAQFSAVVTETASQAYVGTALTVQLALGFLLTTVTIRLIPFLESAVGWRWAFAFLAPGPLLGMAAMLYLRTLPEAARIAGGRR